MNLARNLVLTICVAAAWCAVQNSAQAQTFGAYGAYGFQHPGWFGYYGSPYSLGQIPVPPYFAIHPPVYYSAPVPRSYGYSPYAYPGTVQTPEIVMPEVIENPHVEEVPAPIKESHLKVVRFEVIDNPYVRAELKAKFATRLTARGAQK
jgi:hypothetical protein